MSDPSSDPATNFRRAAVVAVAVCALFAVWVSLSVGGERATTWFVDLATPAGAIVAAVLGFRASRRDPERKRFWFLLGMTLACWASGDLVWAGYELIRGVDAPNPSWADVAYLAGIPFAIAALAAYPTRQQHASGNLRAVLDGLIIASSLLVVSWSFVLGQVVRDGGGPWTATVVAFAYPVSDVVIVSVALIAIHRTRSVRMSPLLLIAAGMLANAVSDSGYAYLSELSLFETGHLLDLGWFGAYVLMALAPLVPVRESPRAATRPMTIAEFATPYIALGVAVLAGVVKITTHQFEDVVLMWTGLITLVLVAARQVVALADNVAYTARLDAQTTELSVALGEATEAARLKTAFLANMSHEIRTPMNGVMGILGLLQERPLDPVDRDYVETMATSAETLMAVINDILDFSKLDAGRVEAEYLPFALRPTVEAAIAGVAARAYDKNIELVSMVDADVRECVTGDRFRLRQVLGNLLDNAVKFSEGGDVVVRVSNDDQSRLRFAVSDSGIGVSPEDQEHLFDAFAQADISTTRRFGGTGLGLMICKQLVELMGGRIGVDSEVGAGSTFWFTVLVEPAEQPPDVAFPAVPADAHLLLVSAHDTAREALRVDLARYVRNVHVASDTTSALVYLLAAADRDEPFDAVIIDDRLERGCGLDFAQRVRALTDVGSPRLIVLARPTDLGPNSAPVDAWVTKPVRMASLLDRVSAVVATPTAAEPVPTAAPPSPSAPPAAPWLGRSRPRARILVVEDNAVNKKVATATLESLGYAVDTADDGVEALDALARRRYEAVLMDIHMPRLDGYGATEEIRRRGDAKTPIIAMTASALESDRAASLASGMNDYLSKPISRQALDDALRHWIAPVASP